MTAYSRLQEKEFRCVDRGYTAVRHQRFVGTGYFDEVAQTIANGQSSTVALEGSTENEQFIEPLPHQAKIALGGGPEPAIEHAAKPAA